MKEQKGTGAGKIEHGMRNSDRKSRRGPGRLRGG